LEVDSEFAFIGILVAGAVCPKLQDDIVSPDKLSKSLPVPGPASGSLFGATHRWDACPSQDITDEVGEGIVFWNIVDKYST
jgi:hypothetical protein